MNFDDILGKLMPLFEQKMAFSMEMSKRAMSLEEKKEASKTDIEYRKLEAQITNEKDRLKWEKEKLTTAVKADYDLQTLKNTGMLDTERLKGLNEKDKQKIMEEGANARNKYTTDSTAKTAYLTSLGTILGHAVEKTGIDAQGNPYSQKPTAEVGNAAISLMEQTGLARPAVTPQVRNVAGEAEVAADILRQHEKAGTADDARNYLNTLDPAVRTETLKLLNPGSSLAPAAGVQPTVSPASAARPTSIAPFQPAVKPAAPVSEPARSAITPALPSPEAIPGRSAYVPPAFNGSSSYGTIAPPRTAPILPSLQDIFPGGVRQSIQDRYSEGIRQSTQAAGKTQEEEEKRRALRRARGLTVGGIF